MTAEYVLTGNDGYNAATGEYVDLVAEGVIDPKKVTRSALQNADSIAGLLLTTECRKEKSPAGVANLANIGGVSVAAADAILDHLANGAALV